MFFDPSFSTTCRIFASSLFRFCLKISLIFVAWRRNGKGRARRVKCFRLSPLVPCPPCVGIRPGRLGDLDAWNGPREARGRRRTRSEAVRVAWRARGSQVRPRGRRAATYFAMKHTRIWSLSVGASALRVRLLIDLCGVLCDEYSERWGLENVSNRRESERREPRSGIGSDRKSVV